MTERRLDHLDPDTIAALVERNLDADDRARAEAHLAICGDCREIWLETSELAGAPSADAAWTPRGHVVIAHRVLSRRWMYAGAALAASVVIAVGLWRWNLARESPVERTLAGLVSDVGDRRFTAGRLSAPFAWGTPPSAQRSGAGVEANLAVQRRAIELQQLAEQRRTAESLHASGLGLLSVGRIDDAIASFEAATREDPGDVATMVDLSAAFLERWRLEGETTEAVKALDQARRALEVQPANIPAAFNHALALEALGLRQQAMEAWKRYLQLDDTSAWSREARERLADLEERQHGPPSLSGLYDELEDERLKVWASAVLRGGPVPAPPDVPNLARTATIDPWIQTAVLAVRTSAPPHRTCLARAFLAISAWRTAFETGHSEAALQAADAAARGFECAGLQPVDAFARRAVSLLELSRLDDADAQAARVIQGSDRTLFRRAHSRALQIRGLVAFQRGRFSDAVEYVSAAIAAAEEAQDRELATALRTILASLYDQQGDERASWEELRHAIAGVSATTSLRRRYAILSSAAGRAAGLNLEGAALTLTDALIAETSTWSNPVGRAVGHLQRAEMYDRLNRVEQARDDIAAAARFLPGIQSQAVRRDLEARVAFYRGLIARNTHEAIESLTRAIDEFLRTDNAIAAAPALLARGRAHRDAAMTDAARADWLRGLALIEDERKEIRAAHLRVSRLDRVWDLYEELIALERDSPLRSLEFAERGRARELLDSLDRTTNTSPRTGSGLLELPSGTQAVIYACLKRELFVWHIRDGAVGLEVKPLGRDRLTAMVDAYRTALQNGAAADSRELWNLLLPASLQTDRTTTILFSPDGPLHALPFAALRKSPADKFLIEQTQPILIASLSSFIGGGAHGRLAGSDALLVGVGQPGENLPRLPFVGEEIAALSRVYPSGTRLIDGAATSDAVRAALPGKAVIHFAGHAVVEPRFPSRSRLVLGKAAERWTVADIARAPVEQGAIVVLGACDTNIGAISRGEGAAALSRAFLSAGASSVIGTLWRVNDRDATPVIVEVHGALARGVSPESALAAAQRSSIARGRPVRAWAAFALSQSRSTAS